MEFKSSSVFIEKNTRKNEWFVNFIYLRLNMSLDIFLYQCTLPIEGQFCLTFCIKTLSLHFLSHRKYQISFILASPEFAFLWNLIEIFIRLYFCQCNASFYGKYIIWKSLITNKSQKNMYSLPFLEIAYFEITSFNVALKYDYWNFLGLNLGHVFAEKEAHSSCL